MPGKMRCFWSSVPCSEMIDRHQQVRANGSADAHPAFAELFEDDGEGYMVKPKSTILFRDRDPEETHLPHCVD